MNNNQLFYRVIGSGYPVVFIHGFLEQSTMWEQLVGKLNSIQAIVIDLPGHGKSSVDDSKQVLTIERMAVSVLRVLETIGLSKYSVVGHSLGGYVALQLAKTNFPPEKIILLNSHPFSDSLVKKQERTQVAKIVETGASHFIRQAIPNLFRNAVNFQVEVDQLIAEANQMSPKGIADATIAMRDREERIDVMELYSDRLLVIQGKYDALIPFEKMKESAVRYQNQFVLLEEAGHMSHIEADSAVLLSIEGFLH